MNHLYRSSEFFKKIGHYKIALLLCALIIVLGLIFSVYFRSAYKDEVIYLQETSEMSMIIKNGEWVGNYGVGLHGFLFKLPVALLFIVTGPSIFVATMFNVIISSLCCYLFYLIQTKYLHFGWWSIAGCLLLISNHQFIVNTPTFLRDIPALFCVLLLLYVVLSRKNKFVIGIVLLLLLDAKEHIFFTIAPAIVLYILLERLTEFERGFINNLRIAFKDILLSYFPSLIFIFLMLNTSIIPINMYTAYILGKTESSPTTKLLDQPVEEDIDTSLGTTFSRVFYDPIKSSNHIFINNKLRNYIDYVIKFYSPRTFGFLSMPFTIVVPSFITSIYMLYHWFRSKQTNLLIIGLITFTHYVFYILNFSHGRYLLPIYPSIIIFFILFLTDNGLVKNVRKILIISGVFLFIELSFESTFILQKVVLYIISYGGLILLFYAKKHNQRPLFPYIVILVCGICISFSAPALAYLNSSKQRGQMYYSRLHGVNSQVSDFYYFINRDKKTWTNDPDIANLINFYTNMNDMVVERDWNLNNKVYKKFLLKENKSPLLYVGIDNESTQFKEYIKINNIKTLFIVHSEGNTNYKFSNEDILNDIDKYYSSNEILSYRTLIFKNKSVHIIEIRT